jgi:5-carboxymethyl-2-hydroxymuconate isomerase
MSITILTAGQEQHERKASSEMILEILHSQVTPEHSRSHFQLQSTSQEAMLPLTGGRRIAYHNTATHGTAL